MKAFLIFVLLFTLFFSSESLSVSVVEKVDKTTLYSHSFAQLFND